MKSLLRRKKLIWTAVILGLLGYYLRYMSLQINGARYTATVMHMANCVNNASITILDYWKENGVTRLPDDVVSSTGEPILSWRVRLLSVDPEGRKIKIDETQSWDSPANAKALEHLPDFCFYPWLADFYPFPFSLFQKRYWEKCWAEQQEPKTCLLRITEVQDALEAGVQLHDDDPYLVMVDNRHAVPWTKPQDVSIREILNGNVELSSYGRGAYIDVKGDYYCLKQEEIIRMIRRLADSNVLTVEKPLQTANSEPSKEPDGFAEKEEISENR